MVLAARRMARRPGDLLVVGVTVPARRPEDQQYMDALDRLDEALAEHYRTGDYTTLGMAMQDNWPPVREALERLRANQRTGRIIHGDATADA